MIHNRQWIWDEEPHVIDETWKYVQTSDKRYLSYQRDLNVVMSADKRVFLLGWAWQTDENHKAPEDVLDTLSKSIDIDELYDIESTWFGRYVVLYHHYVWMDAVGSMGCYYDGDRVSSSLALLWKIRNKNTNESCDVIPHVEVYWGNADYSPGPKTPIDKIKRLMPSQMYDVECKKAEYRSLLKQTFEDLTDEERLERYCRSAVYGLNQMNQSVNMPILCGVTGGKDSRVGVALLESAGIDYKGFTLDLGARSYADVAIAKKIAKLTNKPLEIIRVNQKEDSNRIDAWNTHCAYLTNTRWLYTEHVDERVCKGHKTLSIKCNIFELIEDTYLHEFTSDEYYETYASRGEYFEKAYAEWLNLVKKDTINSNISMSIRMYWDLRMGCWLAVNEQACDILEYMTDIHILNCRRFIELLLGLDCSIRYNREWERIVVEYLSSPPPLAQTPYEETYLDWKIRTYRMYKKISHALKKHLPNKLYKKVKIRFYSK